MKAKRAKRLYKVTAVFLGIFVFLGALLSSVMIADYVVCNRSAHTVPSYEKVDITALADKQEDWTEEEIHTLYLQTGLGKTALLQMKRTTIYEDDELIPLSKRLKKFQDALFYEGETEHEHVADISNRDLMKGFKAPVALEALEAGDVFVNSSTHTLGFRNGHAALALDEYGTVLESYELGVDSAVTENAHLWFAESSNFILLRLKDTDKATRAKIAEDAVEQLLGVPYDISVGLFSKKNQGTNLKRTHCSHLVWQAYKNAGFEIDSNGGLIVTPRDIARSPLFEVIQVYGFDPEKLW